LRCVGTICAWHCSIIPLLFFSRFDDSSSSSRVEQEPTRQLLLPPLKLLFTTDFCTFLFKS
jgi:hypothetical protein